MNEIEAQKIKQRHLDVDILPILVITKTMPAQIVSHAGTGFLIAPNLFISCWHCLRNSLPAHQTYAVCREQKNVLYPLINIQQDQNGTDLATANVALMPEAKFNITLKNVYEGTDVYSFGYPLLNFELDSESGERQLALDFRYLRGYVTRNFWRIHNEFGKQNAYELDMPTPEGLSGAPLFKVNSREVLGVVFGQNEVGLIQHFARIDPETGDREPEIQKVYHFGLAHNTETLRNLKTEATRNLPLHEYLVEDFSERRDSYKFYVKGSLIIDNQPFEVHCKCGFINKFEAPYQTIFCSWCASRFEIEGVMDGVAFIRNTEGQHKVIGTENGVGLYDDEQGLMFSKPTQVIRIIGKERAFALEKEIGPYGFFVKKDLIETQLTLRLECRCGNMIVWTPSHDENELNCDSCGAGIFIYEVEGDDTQIMTSGGPIKIYGT